MSTTTPNLGLFKYDPSTDGAQTFNIQKALNENWDKVDAAVKALSSAAEYSAAQTYALGDYCTHDGKLYRCTTAITEAEAWTEAHWTETSVTAELIAIYTALQKKADSSSVYTKEESISAETRTALSLSETATPDAALAEIARKLPNTVESVDYPGCYYRTVDGVTEWVNPPMEIGVEYRTTERNIGKPVYVKTLDFGALPNNTSKTVSTGFEDYETMPLSAESYFYAGADRHTIPFEHNSMSVKLTNFNGTLVTITTNYNASSYKCYVKTKYTKDAD